MRSIIRHIQQQAGITTIYVTHDQEEALAISDRIAVMYKGEIQQIDEPVKIYRKPKNLFVATFMGQTNILDVDIDNQDVAICGTCLLYTSAVDPAATTAFSPTVTGAIKLTLLPIKAPSLTTVWNLFFPS